MPHLQTETEYMEQTHPQQGLNPAQQQVLKRAKSEQ